jgi:hypothetical protein
MLASLNRRSENVVVEAIIVPELKLRNVKMQVFLTDVVACADHLALEDASGAFNRIGVRTQHRLSPNSMPCSCLSSSGTCLRNDDKNMEHTY